MRLWWLWWLWWLVLLLLLLLLMLLLRLPLLAPAQLMLSKAYIAQRATRAAIKDLPPLTILLALAAKLPREAGGAGGHLVPGHPLSMPPRAPGGPIVALEPGKPVGVAHAEGLAQHVTRHAEHILRLAVRNRYRRRRGPRP